MINRATVSVIVPVFNAEAFIARCAESLLCQTYADVELIFVDDGSTDRSAGILEELAAAHSSARVTVLRQQNMGPQSARMSGLAHAGGEYILFVDADDSLEPDMIESLVKAAEESDADMAYCGIFNETDRGRYVSKDPVHTSCQDAAADILRMRMHGYLWNKLIRKSLLEAPMFHPVISMHEDIVYLCQALHYGGKCVCVPRPLYHYYRNVGGSLSNERKRLRDAMSARNYMQLYDFWKDRLEGSPIEGQEDYIMVRCAWLAWKNDRSVFGEFPYLREMALRVPVSGKLGVKLYRQLILKLVLRKGF